MIYDGTTLEYIDKIEATIILNILLESVILRNSEKWE